MKFPRTYHLPWSPGKGKDDKVHESVDFLLNRPIVITEKLDGENQCWSYTDFHLRSEDSKGGALRSFAKGYWASIRYLLQPGYFYFVEDISNVHSIEYADMTNKLFLIAVCDTIEPNTMTWLSWEDTEYEAKRIEIPTVPRLNRGEIFTKEQLEITTRTISTFASSRLGKFIGMEGIVARPEAHFTDWTTNTAKYVRPNHVKSSDHWVKEQYAKKWRKDRSKNEVVHD